MSHPACNRRKDLTKTAHAEKRCSHKRGIHSIEAIVRRKRNRTQKRRISRQNYRFYNKHALSAHFGVARPVGLPKLAQETPSNQPVLKNKLIKFKIEERLTRFRKYQSIQHKLQNKRQTDQTELGAPNHPQNPTLSAWNYNAPFKVGTINCRGLKGDSALTKKANLISAMEKLNIHIILLQETRTLWRKSMVSRFYTRQVSQMSRGNVQIINVRRLRSRNGKEKGKSRTKVADKFRKILNTAVLASCYPPWQ